VHLERPRARRVDDFLAGDLVDLLRRQLQHVPEEVDRPDRALDPPHQAAGGPED
jgi:hypothetical protein